MEYRSLPDGVPAPIVIFSSFLLHPILPTFPKFLSFLLILPSLLMPHRYAHVVLLYTSYLVLQIKWCNLTGLLFSFQKLIMFFLPNILYKIMQIHL